MAQSDWWRAYFDAAYFSLHEPLFPESESRREVAAMRELLGLPLDARILDVPCGWGRHTRLFASSGYEAFGADLSPALLKRARRGRGMQSRFPRYAAADVRALPFADGVFDAVINVFTSLGFFQNDTDDVRALREARRVLAPGGRFLLETMHRDEVVCAYADSDAWTLPDGTHVEVRRRFEPLTGISHETLRWSRGRKSGEKQHTLRLRTATEVATLLRKAGFKQVAYYGDWEGQPFERDSERLIALAVER